LPGATRAAGSGSPQPSPRPSSATGAETYSQTIPEPQIGDTRIFGYEVSTILRGDKPALAADDPNAKSWNVEWYVQVNRAQTPDWFTVYVNETSLERAQTLAHDLKAQSGAVMAMLGKSSPGDRRVAAVWYPGNLSQGVALPRDYYAAETWQAQRAGVSGVWLSLPIGPRDTIYDNRADAEAALAADAAGVAKPDDAEEDEYEKKARALCKKLGLDEDEIDDEEIREAIVELGEENATGLKNRINNHNAQTLGLAAYALADNSEEVALLLEMSDWVRTRHGEQEYGELEDERDRLRDELEKAKQERDELDAKYNELLGANIVRIPVIVIGHSSRR
jgi:hypothetical protein